jgi:hypothetical protein
MAIFMIEGRGICEGQNAADAVLRFEYATRDRDEVDEEVNEAGSYNEYCQQLLATYSVTEMYRALILETVERRLDGDKRIKIIL